MIRSLFLLVLTLTYCFLAAQGQQENSPIVSYTVAPSWQELRFFWKDKDGNVMGNFQNLIEELEAWQGKELLFAMNGGMYLKDQSPQGLYIEDGKTLSKLNTVKEAYGNFYLQPNGIFYLTEDKQAFVVPTDGFKPSEAITYATQSGPMLVIDGAIHPKFNEGSKSVHIRNGVGVLPDGKVLFAISTEKINLYSFAKFFQDAGCKNALYLDGFVSKCYLPEKGLKQMDGSFGVMIGVSKYIEEH